MGNIIFYTLSLITIISAFFVVLSRNIVHAAFSLLFTLFVVAGLYIFLGAAFLGAVQLILYVGGILILILFGVMLTTNVVNIRVYEGRISMFKGFMISSGIFLILFFTEVSLVRWNVVENPIIPTLHSIGNAFLSRYIFPFEIVSVLLLSVLIGAVIIARKEIK